MLYQIIVTIILAALAVNLVFNLRALKKPHRKLAVNNCYPMISILVPARNEERNITACLKSLRKQNYAQYEILVLDDNSTDKTADVVEALAAADSRLRLISGKALPVDWAGKPHACYQLARAAKGDWLLFVDADTTFEPEMLGSVMDFALEQRPSLLSGFPHQKMDGFPQKLVIPMIYFIMLACTPLWWIQASAKPRPALAIGQFLLFSREEYWRIGGHAAVKARIMEDVWLSCEITRKGGRHITVDLSSLVSCNMYRKLGDMWEGFAKWIYSVATLSPIAIVLLLMLAYVLFLSPYIMLYYDLFIASYASGWRLLLVLQILIIIFMRSMLDHIFRVPVVSAILHPLGFAYLVMVAIYASLQVLAGKGVRWKNRLYSHKSGIS
ncbi:MAG TPA: glycosyltransferase family 2 protein [Dehalococcoidia bacterium]|nr:glycosyltransferase family 2 protein [Dehalococcoidia bacterium]